MTSPGAGPRSRQGFTITELVVASVVLVVVFGFVFATLTRGTRIAGVGLTRIGTAQGVLALRTYLQRDLSRIGASSNVRVDQGPPESLVLSIPGEAEPVQYFTLDGDLFRQHLGAAVRICRNFHGSLVPSFDLATGQVVIDVVGTGPTGAQPQGAPRFQQGYAIASVSTTFDRYYQNWVVRPPQQTTP